MPGIQQTKEVIEAAGPLLAVLIPAIRAGGGPQAIGPRLAAAIASNPDLVGAIKLAADGITEVPAEVKDISMFEGLELAGAALDVARKVATATATETDGVK